MSSNVDLQVCELISKAGEAKSLCYEALVKGFINKNPELAKEKLLIADELILESHRIHIGLLKEIDKNKSDGMMLLLIHAMDILLTTKTEFDLIKILGEEIYSLNNKLDNLLVNNTIKEQ